MAFKTSTIALSIALFGALSFIFGIIAENKKPAAGIPIPGHDVTICKFPSDPTVALGSISTVALVFCTALGFFSIFYSYKGQSVPRDALFQSTTLVVFLGIAVGMSVLGGLLMLWATISESLHRIDNVHHGLDYKCPTAKTGLFGGAAFLCLDAALFWLICQMLTLNARADYLEEDDPKGQYGQVLATDYDANVRAKV
ncbi:Protein of unknown function DUF1218 [Macleaya cordata]|uniref:Uncharacterized protein n=1 Tax=Macleaya cordata TaxID=56857 RepID=A0A200R9I0_MACCD|nr:Protein of unknown function DUF1218 [Macleaya cordata]